MDIIDIIVDFLRSISASLEFFIAEFLEFIDELGIF